MGEPVEVETAERVTTGDERVEAVIRSLDALDGITVEEHVAVFEAAHRELREALASHSEPA